MVERQSDGKPHHNQKDCGIWGSISASRTTKSWSPNSKMQFPNWTECDGSLSISINDTNPNWVPNARSSKYEQWWEIYLMNACIWCEHVLTVVLWMFKWKILCSERIEIFWAMFNVLGYNFYDNDNHYQYQYRNREDSVWQIIFSKFFCSINRLRVWNVYGYRSFTVDRSVEKRTGIS